MKIRIKSSDISDNLEGLMNFSFKFMDKILKINNGFVVLKDSILIENFTSEMLDWLKRFNNNKNDGGIRFPLSIFNPPSGNPYNDFFKLTIKNKKIKSQFEKRFCK